MNSNNRLEASKGVWCLELLFFLCQPWLPFVETRAVIIALHKKVFTGKDIAASKIAPKSTIYRIIKNFKESGSVVVKKTSGCPRKSSKRQDRLLKLIQLQDRGTTSTEHAQEWQQAGVSASARTVRQRILEDVLVSRRAAKKPPLSRKSIGDRLIFCKRYRDWTGVKSFSLMYPHSDCLGHPEKKLVRRRQAGRYHQSCVMSTVKHPETIHVWGCFSVKGVRSKEQFGDEQCFFQHDVAPCHKAKVITKLLGDQNIDVLGPWPGNSPDLNPIENLWSILKRRVDKQKPTNSDKLQALIMQEWATISQDVAQKLIDSMPGQIAEVLEKKGQHCKY
uniref:Transposase n=1 Tax=Oncorhynchus tshawytscha TaxID=74940 RepID=A0AAZ3SMF3_ONCTS